MAEKDFENRLCQVLDAAVQDPTQLQTLTFHTTTSDARTFADLIGNVPYTVFKDTSDWNPCPTLMTELTGKMCPDVVIRSGRSHQNRIYVEVKETRELGYGLADSQIVRYLLHLLATSESKPPRVSDDIRRAIVLAAPSSWFNVRTNAEKWTYFLKTYEPLASALKLTLAAMHLTTV